MMVMTITMTTMMMMMMMMTVFLKLQLPHHLAAKAERVAQTMAQAAKVARVVCSRRLHRQSMMDWVAKVERVAKVFPQGLFLPSKIPVVAGDGRRVFEVVFRSGLWMLVCKSVRG